MADTSVHRGAAQRRLSRFIPGPVALAALLLGAALVTWIVTVERMKGMDAGPGTDLGGLGWYVGIWVTMMAAMMLPSVVPMALIFAKVARGRAEHGHGHAYVPPWIFLAGYLLAWTLYGLLAYGIFRAIKAADWGFLEWDAQGPIVAGIAITAAGLYQLTPLKEVCLRHCRGPLHFILHGWRNGRVGAARMGFEHGLFCVGCCWGLMIVLFALGVMSLVWMAVVAVLIFAEKVLPHGDRLTRPIAVLLVALGIWVAVAPQTVPGLTQPDSPTARMMRMNDGSNGSMMKDNMTRGQSDSMTTDQPTTGQMTGGGSMNP
jgi:predicted metal-binding membrane protein